LAAAFGAAFGAFLIILVLGGALALGFDLDIDFLGVFAFELDDLARFSVYLTSFLAGDLGFGLLFDFSVLTFSTFTFSTSTFAFFSASYFFACYAFVFAAFSFLILASSSYFFLLAYYCFALLFCSC
jgi:hypothetical protein